MRRIRPIADADRPRLTAVLTRSWGSTRMATRGRLIDVSTMPGYVADDGDEWLGYVTYEIVDDAMEVLILEALAEHQGVASALLAACVRDAQAAGARRMWLITTNDNLTALRFYQRRGFVMVALHMGAINDARMVLKPEIPMTGEHEIPLRDELELELPSVGWAAFVESYAWPQT